MLAEPNTIASGPPTGLTGELRVEQVRGVFLCLAAVLLGFGVLMVHSASITSWPTEFERIYLSRHVIFLAVGAVAATICSYLPARFWYRAAPALFAASAVLLVLVLIPGIGTKVNGAQRWLRYGPLSLQPSEFAKIALPLFVCRQLCVHCERFARWFGGLIPVAAPAVIVLPLVILQPNFGTAAFLAAGCGIALMVGGWPMRHFILSASLLIPAVVGQFTLRPYQMRRITGLLAAWSDLSLAPYQLKQSLVTLGAGGLFGVGLGKGWQKLSFLPEANTDFVFAVVGEELGMVGTLSLVLVWAAMYVTGLRLLKSVDRHSFAFAAGFTLLTQLVLQAVMNMAVVTALVPPTGIPHPFLSYGGSNLVSSMISLGIIVGLTRTEADDIDRCV
ncbi:MAG: putative peptidoglycan glycosyltransferase FtsW [Planctomycetaceae bacterium]